MKNVFITGISTGIGYDACRYFLLKGCSVFGSVRNEADRNRLLSDFPHKLSVYIFDVTDKSAILDATSHLQTDLNGEVLHALINNAGMAVPGPQRYLPDEDFDYQFKVNVHGVRNVTNAFLPFLGASLDWKKEKGMIINISSISALFNSPFYGSYCVSKAALESLSEVYRRELLLYGIDVVCINPGPIQSEIWDKNLGKLDKFLNTDYQKVIAKANAIIEQSRDNALPLESVSKGIYQIFISKSPPLNRIIHKDWLKFWFMRKLPRRWVDKIILKNMMSDKIKPLR